MQAKETQVHVFTVDQTCAISECASQKSAIEFSPEYIIQQKMLGNDMITVKYDTTIILGKFTWENGIHNPKLLLLRTNGILSNKNHSLKEKNEMANAIYKSLCPLVGTRGYELRQLCGSSGDRDYLTCINCFIEIFNGLINLDHDLYLHIGVVLL